MKAHRTLMVHTAALSGEPSFVIACDDPTLRWLDTSFRTLRDRRTVRFGDGLPIESDGRCMIDLVPGAPETFVAQNPKHFRWVLPPAQARRYADLIGAMARTTGPCHQYLEGKKPGMPIVIVTKDEYDVAALRKMRDGPPRPDQAP